MAEAYITFFWLKRSSLALKTSESPKKPPQHVPNSTKNKKIRKIEFYSLRQDREISKIGQQPNLRKQENLKISPLSPNLKFAMTMELSESEIYDCYYFFGQKC